MVEIYAKTLPENNGIAPGNMVITKQITNAEAAIAINSIGEVIAIKKDCLIYWKKRSLRCE